MADDEDTQETPAAETPEHAVPTEEATEIAGSAEDAALEALQESQEHPQAESTESEQQFEPIPGNAVPSEEATEIAGSAEDAPLEAAQERAEAETVEEAVAEEIIEEALVEEIAEEAVAEEIAEEIVAEAVAEELVEEAIEEAVAEEIAEEVVAEVELEEEIEEEATPRVKPAVPGAHLEVDIVPEGVDPLGTQRGLRGPLCDRGRGVRERGGQPAGGPGGGPEQADLHRRDRPGLRRAVSRDGQAQDGGRAGNAATG